MKLQLVRNLNILRIKRKITFTGEISPHIVSKSLKHYKNNAVKFSLADYGQAFDAATTHQSAS